MKLDDYLKKRLEYINRRIEYLNGRIKDEEKYLNKIKNTNFVRPNINDDNFNYEFNKYRIKKLENDCNINILQTKIDMLNEMKFQIEREKVMLIILKF